MKNNRFEVHKNGDWFIFIFIHNGDVLATSEKYYSKKTCIEGIEQVKKLACEAEIIEV